MFDIYCCFLFLKLSNLLCYHCCVRKLATIPHRRLFEASSFSLFSSLQWASVSKRTWAMHSEPPSNEAVRRKHHRCPWSNLQSWKRRGGDQHNIVLHQHERQMLKKITVHAVSIIGNNRIETMDGKNFSRSNTGPNIQARTSLSICSLRGAPTAETCVRYEYV